MPKVPTVIQALIDYKGPIEGHDLAKLTNVSIHSVHSAIHAAKQKGYVIHKHKVEAIRPVSGRSPVAYKFISGPTLTLLPQETQTQQETKNPLVRVALANKQASPVHKTKSTTLTDRCYHFLKARHVTTTSYQVADFFDISNDQAVSLVERVAAMHDCLSLSVSVRVLEVR